MAAIDMENAAAFTCRQLMQAVSMQGARLLTGEAGLDAPVTSVNVIEVPDIADWTHPGEFLLTTGYPFKDDQNRLFELIGSLSKIGVAALGIKLHRFIETLSPEIIDYAQALRFPLIELGPQANFSEIVQEVTRRILESDRKNVMALQGQVEILVNRFSQGESLESILSTLEDLTGYAALLVCPGLQPILGGKAESILSGAPPQVFAQLEEGKAESINPDGSVRRVKYQPIFWGEHFGGQLALLEDRCPFGPSDAFLLGQIKGLLSLELRNRTAIEELKLKYRNRFLQRLLTGKMANETDIYLEAKSYGYPLHFDTDYVVALVAHTMGGRRPDESELFRFSNQSRSEDGWMTAVLEGNLVIILPSGPGVRDRLKALCREWPGIFEENCVSFCLSKPAPVTALAEAYQEAARIMEISYRSGVADLFIEMEDLGIYAVLTLLPASETVNRFIQRQLAPLKEYDRRHNSMLYTTLKVYLQKNANAKATAETLYTHYNTIIYRLDRIARILDIDLDDVEVQFALRLALKLDAMQSAQNHKERRES
ncbi:MAG TPA: PucR family transcriptional regulator ligand-binding domain-containing protein [Firmicutes bacterium]|nr:PucR family transcriptional regulator ligand-binding domain-containing protein [Bacillota bacterium]